jgi:hypothetical protein
MILTELIQTSYPEKLTRRVIRRQLRTFNKQSHKHIRLFIRSARGKTALIYRRQYFLSHAYKDLKSSAKLNEDIFLSSLMISVVLGFCAAKLAAETTYIFLRTAYEVSELTGTNALFFGSIALGVLTVLTAWVIAFLFNTVSIASMEGLTRKTYRSIRRTLRQGLAHASRVTGAWFLIASLIIIPLGLSSAGAAAYLYFNPVSLYELLETSPYAIIAAMSWMFTILMNYSLAPQVALFEPEVSITRTLGRSRQLVKKRGRIFVLFLHIAIAAFLLASLGLAVLVENLVGVPKVLPLSLAVFTACLSLNSMLTVLYRKRRLARTH